MTETINFESSEEIIDVSITDTTVEVTKRKRSTSTYACFPPRPVPDIVWKEIYKVIDNKIVFIKNVKGIHRPAYTVHESFTFPHPNACPECGSTNCAIDHIRNEKICNDCKTVWPRENDKVL